jgi:hypothetical protein
MNQTLPGTVLSTVSSSNLDSIITTNGSSARSFRLHRDEAARLNLTDSILVHPGEDFGTELGLIHNLHCLVRALSAFPVRQFHHLTCKSHVETHSPDAVFRLLLS